MRAAGVPMLCGLIAARVPRARARATPCTATILVILDKAQQAEDILEPDEPRHRRQDEAYDRDGIDLLYLLLKIL